MAEKKDKEVTVNLDIWGVPIAMVIVALIIVGIVAYSNRNGSSNTSTTQQNNVPSQGSTNGATNSTDSSSSGRGDSGVSATVDNDPYLGDLKQAKVAVVEFSDPTCHYCHKHATETFPSIKKEYIDTGKIVYVFKEWPRGNNGSLTYEISESGMCVFDQKGIDAFLKYHEGAFEINNLAGIKTLVSSLGVDMGQYDTCMKEGKFVSDLSSDRDEGTKAGINGTPGFVVGRLDENGNVTGSLIGGFVNFDKFKSRIESYLNAN